MSLSLASQKSRLHFIDSLRGLAALYVLIFHIAIATPSFKPILPGWIEPLIVNGGTGVTLFFVISAFTLCYMVKAREGEENAERKFYIRRFFRIAPLYYLWLITMVAVYWDLFTILHRKKDLLLYIGFGFNFLPGRQDGLVSASWTLGVEMIFYFFFPLLFRYVNSLRRSLVFTFITLIIAFLHFQVSKSFFPPLYEPRFSLFHQLPVFAVGMNTYFLYERIKVKPKTFGLAFIVISLAGILILPYLLMDKMTIFFIYPMSIFYSLLLLGLSIYPIKPIVNRFSFFFGLISYSLYLNHPRLVYYSGPVYEYIYSLPYPTFIHFLMCTLLTLTPLTAFSYLTYHYIEKPGITFGNKLIRRVFEKKEARLPA